MRKLMTVTYDNRKWVKVLSSDGFKHIQAYHRREVEYLISYVLHDQSLRISKRYANIERNNQRFKWALDKPK